MSGQTWIIVLAGGCGIRLAGESHRRYGYARPKQFCDFDGRGTLLARTILRAKRIVPEERLVVITTRPCRAEARETLCAFPAVIHVEQPRAIGTTAGIALPLLHVLARDPDAIVVVFPSDHGVADDAPFARAAADAVEVAMADRDRLVLVGARTERFEEGYGWVVPQASAGQACLGVARFREKPPPEEAEALIAAGALVNTFVIAGGATAFAAAIGAHAPEQWRVLSGARLSADLLDAAYKSLPSSNFSSDVLEAAVERLGVVELPLCGWSDLGTPERLHASIRVSSGQHPLL